MHSMLTLVDPQDLSNWIPQISYGEKASNRCELGEPKLEHAQLLRQQRNKKWRHEQASFPRTPLDIIGNYVSAWLVQCAAMTKHPREKLRSAARELQLLQVTSKSQKLQNLPLLSAASIVFAHRPPPVHNLRNGPSYKRKCVMPNAPLIFFTLNPTRVTPAVATSTLCFVMGQRRHKRTNCQQMYQESLPSQAQNCCPNLLASCFTPLDNSAVE